MYVCTIITIIIILGIYYMLFLQKVQGAHSLLQAYNKLQIHCCETLLQLQKIDKTLQKNTHSSNSTADKGLRETNKTDTFKQLVGKTEKVDGKGGF